MSKVLNERVTDFGANANGDVKPRFLRFRTAENTWTFKKAAKLSLPVISKAWIGRQIFRDTVVEWIVTKQRKIERSEECWLVLDNVNKQGELDCLSLSENLKLTPKAKNYVLRPCLKCDGTRAETIFLLSVKRTSPFTSAGASVQSTAGSRGVRFSGSNAGYTMFRGSVKSTGYLLYSPVSPLLPLPCVTVCHQVSTGLYTPRTGVLLVLWTSIANAVR